METDNISIGDLLYLERHKRRLTLRDAAHAVECSAMYLSKIENGKLLPLKSTILPKLAAFYELDASDILKRAYQESYMKHIENQDFNVKRCEQEETIAARRNLDILKQKLERDGL